MLHFLKRFTAIMLCTGYPIVLIAVCWVAMVAMYLVPQTYDAPIGYVIRAMGSVLFVRVVADIVMPASTREALLKSLR